MVKHNIVALLYSQKNYELSFKMQKWCNSNKISFINVVDFIDLSIKIAQIKPTLLFIDTTMPDFQQESFNLFVNSSELNNTKIIYVVNHKISNTIKIILSENSTCLDVSEIKEYLNTYSPQFSLEYLKLDNSNIINFPSNDKLNIGQFLINLGINPKHTGYQYLKYIISSILTENYTIVMLNKFYPHIAALYKTNPANIERDIRNAIKRAWECFGVNNWCEHLYQKTETNKRPTNREFICYVVERLESGEHLKSAYSIV